ncbi:YopX family protein [Francisella hispaniensis]|uniref:YopX protein domain-containing protein n=1 Tax=Francisella hispaniensis TaxID=622488 RepID=F4BFT1_9GAMM|nr:YopX family protein [Francisella hispaniensis]AEE26325.1 hypothetical protein FN3523_1022 [Francisella hispaniensis]
MREIKFRAWDKKNKKMLKFNEIYPSMYTYDDSLEAMFSNAKDDGLEFMQYTGFEDENGVEIYTGDIVEYANTVDSYVGVVEYVNRYTAFRCVFPDGRWTDLYECIKVIGNKFENLEILEK